MKFFSLFRSERVDTNIVYHSNLEYGAFLVYSPHGSSKTSIESRVYRDLIKRDGFLPDKRSFIAASVEKLAELIQSDEMPVRLLEVIGTGKILVPVPGNSPMSDPHALWVPKRICDELVKAKLGKETACLLKRISAVQKAAFARSAGKARPTVKEHIDSLRCELGFAFGQGITLIDDFVTSGTQLTAVASLLKTIYPTSEIDAFALVRTMSGEEVEQVIVPYRGKIEYSPGSSYSVRS